MTKAEYPQIIKAVPLKSIKTRAEEISSAFDHWVQCRQENHQAQTNLLKSCRDDQDVRRYKSMGLLEFGHNI